MDNLTVLKVGEEVSPNLKKSLDRVVGDRAFFNNSDGIPQLFIVMNNIQKKEIESFKGALTVRSSIKKGLSFIGTKFSMFEFEMPLIPTFYKEELGNGVSIFLIEENSKILKAIRMIGLSSPIMKDLNNSCLSFSLEPSLQNKEKREVDFRNRVLSIYRENTTETLFANGQAQLFKRV